jgi:hypothetical protein
MPAIVSAMSSASSSAGASGERGRGGGGGSGGGGVTRHTKTLVVAADAAGAFAAASAAAGAAPSRRHTTTRDGGACDDMALKERAVPSGDRREAPEGGVGTEANAQRRAGSGRCAATRAGVRTPAHNGTHAAALRRVQHAERRCASDTDATQLCQHHQGRAQSRLHCCEPPRCRTHPPGAHAARPHTTPPLRQWRGARCRALARAEARPSTRTPLASPSPPPFPLLLLVPSSRARSRARGA